MLVYFTKLKISFYISNYAGKRAVDICFFLSSLSIFHTILNYVIFVINIIQHGKWSKNLNMIFIAYLSNYIQFFCKYFKSNFPIIKHNCLLSH